MTGDHSLFRASFNFTSKCNLACRFCYIPFDEHAADAAISLEVVTRLVELGVRSITFGGGDPLKHPPIIELLTHARTAGVPHIQIDTNALGWASKHLLDRVAGIVDVVGLPLDGATPEMHGVMRSHARSWADSVSAAIFLQSRVDLKINTVVGAPNIEHLYAMTTLVGQLAPRIWSLYEFWAIGPIAQKHTLQFSLRPEQFALAAQEIRQALVSSDIEVEISSIEERSPSYFLVTDTGAAYAVDPTERTRYVHLGSVFDKGILARWADVADTERNRSRTASRFGIGT